MSQITGLNKLGKERYTLFLDGAYFCTLNCETIVKAGLKIGTEISKEELENIQAENEKLTAFDRSLKYLANLKTEKQVRDYLYSKGYTAKTVNYCISKLNEYKYLDDKEYAKVYIRSYANRKGKRLIEFELKTKGIKEDIIKELFEDFQFDEEVLLELSEKFLKNRPRDRKTAQKLFAHLSSKGFEFEKINGVIKKLIYDFENTDME